MLWVRAGTVNGTLQDWCVRALRDSVPSERIISNQQCVYTSNLTHFTCLVFVFSKTSGLAVQPPEPRSQIHRHHEPGNDGASLERLIGQRMENAFKIQLAYL